MRGEAIENYLKSIYQLSRVGGETGGEQATAERVGTLELAQRLGVTPASASRMMQRLASLGLVEHEQYRGASLTPEGERVALEIIRHHRLLELYLHNVLGYPWDRVHEEAERLEHYISEEFEARIFEALGRPVVDPHGDPIPTLEGTVPPEYAAGAATQRALAQLAERERAIVRQVPSSDPEKLRYLAEIGLVPGAEVELLERYPFGGGLRLRVGAAGQERIVGHDLATAIGVACVPPAEDGSAAAPPERDSASSRRRRRARPDDPPRDARE